MATFIPNVTDVFPEPALFTPDFSFMDKMLQRRQSMYDQGWSQLNAAYNFVNKDLTNPQNLKDREIFLKQAKNNLKGLAGMDLSQHQNVISARGVFEPWANNKKALGDATLTSHWKQQLAIGEGYRLEDGGKYFNQYNIDYVRKQQAAFAGDVADSWEDYWKNKRSYTPYYDYHKEVQDLMKDFKPSTTEIDKINGLYKYTIKKADWTQAEIRKYLEANLSDKAKQQMKIEGDVLYNNNPQQMGQIYTTMAKDEIRQYDAGISLATSQLKRASKPEDIKKLKDYITSLEDRKKGLNANLEAIGKGDFTYVKKKGEEIASNIYFNQFMNKVSNGFAHADHSFKISGDDVGLTLYRERKEDERQLKAFAHAEKMAMMKGEIAPPPQINELQIDEPKEVTLKSMNEDVVKIEDEQVKITDMNKGMVAKWKQSLPENKGKIITVKDVTNEDMTAFEKTGFNGKPIPPTHPYKSNLKALAELKANLNIAQNRLTKAVESVKAEYTPEQRAALENATAAINKMGTFTMSDGTVISAKDLNASISSDPAAISYGSWGAGVGDVGVRINGKTYYPFGDGKHSEKQIIEFANWVNRIKEARNDQDALTKFDDDVKGYFKKHQAELTQAASSVLTFSKGSYEAKTLEAEMYNILPEAGYSIQHAGVGADVNNQTSAYFYITPKEGVDKDDDDIVKYLQQRGYKDVVAHTQSGTGVTLFEIKNLKSPITSSYTNYNTNERAILNDLATQPFTTSGTGMYQTAPYYSNSDRKLMITRDHNMYYLMVEGLDGGGTMDEWPIPFPDANSAILQGQTLTATQMINGVSVPEAQLKAYQRLNK